MAKNFDFVVFSHLRWDFVLQRPQHLMGRFAKDHRVIFIEEPVPVEFTKENENANYWEIRNGADNIFVCRAHTSEATHGFSDPQIAAMQRMMPDLIRRLQIENHAVWFYTPMALPLIEHFTPKAVVYDCMDELSAFLHAPKELIDREQKLLKLADLVFTGGPSLYRAKKHHHPNVHCFSSSVDAKHYAVARPGSKIEAEDQKNLSKPRLGYFGVIDERVDLQILDQMAKTHPEWEICMVGPVVKIDPASLPKHANLHYFGQRQYADLPSYLAGWDVCLLPFARNESTKFISPTKILEYMASERMIVSTSITDVEEPYGHIAYLGDTPAGFTAACESAMKVSPGERARRVDAMRQVLSKTSWDSTAALMLELIEEAISKTSHLGDGVFVPATAKQRKPETSVVEPVWAVQTSQVQGD